MDAEAKLLSHMPIFGLICPHCDGRFGAPLGVFVKAAIDWNEVLDGGRVWYFEDKNTNLCPTVKLPCPGCGGVVNVGLAMFVQPDVAEVAAFVKRKVDQQVPEHLADAEDMLAKFRAKREDPDVD